RIAYKSPQTSKSAHHPGPQGAVAALEGGEGPFEEGNAAAYHIVETHVRTCENERGAREEIRIAETLGERCGLLQRRLQILEPACPARSATLHKQLGSRPIVRRLPQLERLQRAFVEDGGFGVGELLVCAVASEGGIGDRLVNVGTRQAFQEVMR